MSDNTHKINPLVRFFSLRKKPWFPWVLIAILLCFIFVLLTVGPNYFKLKIGENELTINKIEVEAIAGNIAIQSSGGTKNVVVMVSASGSRGKKYSPWVRTGIHVSPKNTVKIEASGNVHTALARLIKIAQTDMIPNPDQYQSWVDQQGDPGERNDWDEKRKKLRLVPEQSYGSLVAAIWDGKNPVKDDTKGSIDEKKQFEVKREGELVLAVNDILLNEKVKDLYALPIKGNDPYYRSRLIDKYGKMVDSWAKDKVVEKSKELYQEKVESWEQIEQYSRWTVWFDDNVGQFFVSITKT
jgi:hypothetical protein